MPPSDLTNRRQEALLPLLGGYYLIATVAAAFSPLLALHAPLLLVGLSPGDGHLLLAIPQAGVVAVGVVAVFARFGASILVFSVGRRHGEWAQARIRARGPRARRFLGWIERRFARTGPLVVFFFPGFFGSLLAGATGMRPRWALSASLAGHLARVTVIGSIGVALQPWLQQLLGFLARHQAAIAVAGALLASVALTVALVRRRGRLPQVG